LFNLSPLSVIIIILCSVVLVFGVKDSARFNLVITTINLCTILFVIILGAFYVDIKNWDPFLPLGISGAFSGAGTVFFSYIGFDSVSSLAGEVKRPSRDLPIGIVGTLLIATVLYVGVSLVITGMINYSSIDIGAPLSAAFAHYGLEWASVIISIGSVTALTATTLCSLLGQPRIYFQMAKDGLIPPQFAKLHPKSQAPIFGTIVTGILAASLALLLDLTTLTEMISIGTLLAFTVVCAGVIEMRFDKHGSNIRKVDGDSDKLFLLHDGTRKENKLENFPTAIFLFAFFIASCIFSIIYKNDWPYWLLPIPGTPMLAIYVIFQLRRQVNVPPTFKCPLVPLIPLVGMAVNTFLIMQLPFDAIKSVMVWSAIGFTIYFGYGIHHSKLNEMDDGSAPLKSLYRVAGDE